MKRKKFITSLLVTSIFIAMDGFSSVINAMTGNQNEHENDTLYATFGAVHLNVTSLEKSTEFWTKIVGMKLRKSESDSAEFGSETKTLVVIHQTAKIPYQKGYSGLYHFAIHPPTKSEFAKMLYRLVANNYPCSPVDHTMSQSVYMEDPDGITIEFALETPERFKRVVTNGGLQMEDVNGNLRSASAPLDVEDIFKSLPNKDLNQLISDECKIGHLHLYANDVEKSNTFYKNLGFQQFNHLPQFMYADVSAGGPYKHRIAMNSWHGQNKPLAPKESAGLHQFQINFESKDRLLQALKNVNHFEKENDYWVNDPTGNLILLTHN